MKIEALMLGKYLAFGRVAWDEFIVKQYLSNDTPGSNGWPFYLHTGSIDDWKESEGEAYVFLIEDLKADDWYGIHVSMNWLNCFMTDPYDQEFFQ
jgi:hypothetical protein